MEILNLSDQDMQDTAEGLELIQLLRGAIGNAMPLHPADAARQKQRQKKKKKSLAGSRRNNNKDNKEMLRQACIGKLRRLSQRGILAPRQKRVLLSDIIFSSSNGKHSLVETAYEL